MAKVLNKRTEEAQKLAEEHWEWLELLLHKIYVDAMIHGIKHGQDNTKIIIGDSVTSGKEEKCYIPE